MERCLSKDQVSADVVNLQVIPHNPEEGSVELVDNFLPFSSIQVTFSDYYTSDVDRR